MAFKFPPKKAAGKAAKPGGFAAFLKAKAGAKAPASGYKAAGKKRAAKRK